MNTIQTLTDLRAALVPIRQQGQRIAFVPTMGNLHDGHIALIHRARQQADFVVASIFVNPLQFGPTEDLDSYPRTLAADQEKLQRAGCNLLFAPSVDDMYPHGQEKQTRIQVPGVSEGLCGDRRPGHFTGVATVVCKLFNRVQPDVAIFGQKDFQQLAVIRTLVRDLDMPVEIVGEPTVRAEDGLALSSRNGYLTPTERMQAPALYHSLQRIAQAIQGGQSQYEALCATEASQLQAAGWTPDYLEVRDALTLEPVSQATPQHTQLVVLGAAFLGKTRLIDNLIVDHIGSKS